MASRNSQPEVIKEAVTAATRAISGNSEIEVNFGGLGSATSGAPKSKEELKSFRGKADSLACAEKYRDKSIRINSSTDKINSLIKVMEDTRVEILGSLDYPGVYSNIAAKFKNKAQLYKGLENQEDFLEIALESWLRESCLSEDRTFSNEFLDYWGELFENQDSKLKDDLFSSLENQSKFLEHAENFLKSLRIDDDESDSEDNEIEDETEQEDEAASEEGEDDDSLESESSPEQENQEGAEETEADMGDIDGN